MKRIEVFELSNGTFVRDEAEALKQQRVLDISQLLKSFVVNHDSFMEELSDVIECNFDDFIQMLRKSGVLNNTLDLVDSSFIDCLTDKVAQYKEDPGQLSESDIEVIHTLAELTKGILLPTSDGVHTFSKGALFRAFTDGTDREMNPEVQNSDGTLNTHYMFDVWFDRVYRSMGA